MPAIIDTLSFERVCGTCQVYLDIQETHERQACVVLSSHESKLGCCREDSWLAGLLRALAGDSTPADASGRRPGHVAGVFILLATLALKEWVLRYKGSVETHDVVPARPRSNPLDSIHFDLGGGLSFGTDKHGHVP